MTKERLDAARVPGLIVQGLVPPPLHLRRDGGARARPRHARPRRRRRHRAPARRRAERHARPPGRPARPPRRRARRRRRDARRAASTARTSCSPSTSCGSRSSRRSSRAACRRPARAGARPSRWTRTRAPSSPWPTSRPTTPTAPAASPRPRAATTPSWTASSRARRSSSSRPSPRSRAGRPRPSPSSRPATGRTRSRGARCATRTATARLTLADAIVHSSNIGMALTAERMGRGPLYRTARALGFGQPTTIDLPGRGRGQPAPARDVGRDDAAVDEHGLRARGDAAPDPDGLRRARQRRPARPPARRRRAPRRPHGRRRCGRPAPDSVRRAFSEETARALHAGLRARRDRARRDGRGGAGRGPARRGQDGHGADGRQRPLPQPVPRLVRRPLPGRGARGGAVRADGLAAQRLYGGVVAAPVFGRVARRWIGTFPRVAQRVAPAEAVPHRAAAARAGRRRDAGRCSPPAACAPRASTSTWLDARAVAAGLALGRAGRPRRAPPCRARSTSSRPSARGPRRRPPQMPDLRGQSVRTAVSWLRALGVAPVVTRGRAPSAPSPSPPAGRSRARSTLTGQPRAAAPRLR